MEKRSHRGNFNLMYDTLTGVCYYDFANSKVKVYLAILTAISNKAMAFAMVQGTGKACYNAVLI